MASSRFLISSQTLASSAASVTFSSIPATYTDLVLKISARASAAGTYGAGLVLTLNSDTTTLYSITRLGALDNSTIVSRASASSPINFVDFLDTAGNTTNTFSSIEIYIPNYNSSSSKPISVSSVTENNSVFYAALEANAGLYRGTSGITTIKVDPSSNWVSGSSFYLYGLKNS